MAPVPSDESTTRSSDISSQGQASSTGSSSTTPPARSPNLNEDNPFVQFRRFADSQFSSLLQSLIGLPSLFEQPSPHARWVVIKSDGNGNEEYINGDTETMKQRKLYEEGWKKQREQVIEEQKREAETTSREDLGTNREDVAGAGRSHVGQRYPNGDPMPSQKSGGIFGWLGWNGKRKQEDGSRAFYGRAPAPILQAQNAARNYSEFLNPFNGNETETLAWLFSNQYSPIFLRGHLPEDIHEDFPSFLHAINHPHWPDFRAASSPDRFENELRFRVPWCDAFEDLLSLENTGHMIDREEPTRSSSLQWLNDMRHRGSLGPKWIAEDARSSCPAFGMADKPGYSAPVEYSEDFSPRAEQTQASATADADAAVKAVGVLFGLAKNALPDYPDAKPEGDLNLFTSPEVICAVMRAALQAEKDSGYMDDEDEEDYVENDELSQYEQQLDLLEQQNEERLTMARRELEGSADIQDSSKSNISKTPLSSTSTSTSSSTSWWSHLGDVREQKDSIVSTMTTTERRTLPDGTVETRRVLKKKFADGREESNESVERQTAPPLRSGPSLSRPGESGSSIAHTSADSGQQDKQTQTQKDFGGEKARRSNGWFWK